jgi:hypothetical protein
MRTHERAGHRQEVEDYMIINVTLWTVSHEHVARGGAATTGRPQDSMAFCLAGRLACTLVCMRRNA